MAQPTIRRENRSMTTAITEMTGQKKNTVTVIRPMLNRYAANRCLHVMPAWLDAPGRWHAFLPGLRLISVWRPWGAQPVVLVVTFVSGPAT